MAAPLGRVRATASGSGVRAGSVKNSSRGRAFHTPPRGRKSAAVLAKLQKPSEMAVTPSASASAYLDVVARIGRAAQAAGRTAADVTLVAVSKTQPWEAVAPVLAAGQTPDLFLAALRQVVPVHDGTATPRGKGEVSMFLDGRWYALDLSAAPAED